MRRCPACLFDRCDDHATQCRQCGAELTPLDQEQDHQHYNLDSAYFHYLKIPKIGTIELVPGRAFRMGRGPRNELVIPKTSAEEVAEIFWTDRNDEATVREMGSKDAVKVESIRIKGTRTLKGGEEIQVGPMVMSYLRRLTPVEGAINAGKISKRGRGVNPGRGVDVGVRRPGKREALDPNARTLPKKQPTKRAAPKVVKAAPGRVARVLEQNKVTGTFRVSSRRGRGWITLMSGKPQSAVFGESKGLRALEQILALPDARCQLDQGLPRRGSGKPITVTIGQVLAKLAGPRRPPPGRRPPPPGRGRGGPPPRRRR